MKTSAICCYNIGKADFIVIEAVPLVEVEAWKEQLLRRRGRSSVDWSSWLSEPVYHTWILDATITSRTELAHVAKQWQKGGKGSYSI